MVINIFDLLNIITQATEILQYFVPGYVFVILFRHFCTIKTERAMTIVMSVVISYIFLSLISLIYSSESSLQLSAIAILLGFVTAIPIAKLFTSEWLKKLMLKGFYKTPHEDIWKDVLDYKEGSLVKVYLKGKDYWVYGQYRFNEDKGENSWFAISAYGKYDSTKNDECIQEYHENEKRFMVFRLSDVDYIEIS